MIGIPATGPLVAAIADSGLRADLVEPNAFIVVDAVHGAALGVGAANRHDTDDLAALRTAFEIGIDTIVAGITTLARDGSTDGER